MNEKMVEAIRREAFTQGYMRGRFVERGRTLSEAPDAEVLLLLHSVDDAYTTYRAERGK